MKIIARRVLSASVVVDNREVSSINQGLLLYVGFMHGDTPDKSEYLAKKIVNLRIFDSANTEISVKDIQGEILSVSQFTLSADTKKGFRPSYTKAMPSREAIKYYDYFNKCLADELGTSVKTGIFGADMQIMSLDDGPFTILFEQ